MKQNKFGKKVQNWHRPLGRSQLRERYLALRYDDAEYTKPGQIVSHGIEPFEVDQCWDPYDPLSDDLYDDYTDGFGRSQLYLAEEDYFEYNLNYLWQKFSTPVHSVFDGLVNSSSEIAAQSKLLLKHDRLEQSLADYINKMSLQAINSQDNDGFYTEMINDIATIEDRDVITKFASNPMQSGYAKDLMLFAPFWIRRPSSWQGGDEESLLKHLFVLHDSPDFLYRAIVRSYRPTGFKWLCWLILLGQGGSLKRAAPLFDWNIQGRFSHYLQCVPNGLSATESCIYAEVKKLGGDDSDFNRILNGHTLVIDPTDKPQEKAYPLFWQSTVTWLIKYKNDISDDECSLIMRWALHRYTEGQRQGRQLFSWKGRTVNRTVEKANEYQLSLSRPYLQFKWNSHNWDWVHCDESEDKWTFEELTSGEALYNEGLALKHCVSSYASRCAASFSAIISIKVNRLHRLTAELNPSTKKIVQLRGQQNRSANMEEKRIVAEWLHNIANRDN